MNDRERLIELLRNFTLEQEIIDNHDNVKGFETFKVVVKGCESYLADYLIANGVTLYPKEPQTKYSRVKDVPGKGLVYQLLFEFNGREYKISQKLPDNVSVQKHGRWVMKDTAYACSECGCGFAAPVSYCFSCGARMDLEAEI